MTYEAIATSKGELDKVEDLNDDATKDHQASRGQAPAEPLQGPPAMPCPGRGHPREAPDAKMAKELLPS